MMMNSKARKLVNDVTFKELSIKEWKKAVYRMYALFGESALYYINCQRFLREGDEDAYALPYEVREKDGRIHFGFQIQHSYYDEEMDQCFANGGEIYLFT